VNRRALALWLYSSVAYAAPPIVASGAKPVTIVAVAGPPASAVLVGKSGETYEPDGKGAWIRHADGGIAGEVVAATREGDVVIAGVANEPPFERLHTGWSVMTLGLHASALLGRGSRATAAVGRSIFALERGKATKLAEAPAPVVALAASPNQLVVETERGLARWNAGKWQPLAKAPHHVAMLLDPRWAVVERGVIELDTGKLIGWPLGFHVQVAIAAGDAVIAASARELVTIKASSVAHEPLPALASPVAGLAADRSGRVVLATRGGQVAERTNGAWTVTEARDEPPATHDGPPPAESK
jgi:hypothetical protein